MEENCITVDKLSKSFGQRKVIDNLFDYSLYGRSRSPL